jgi:glutamate synthase (ferredoxin)
MREFDACGIGFVADAQGRASRAIVANALHGLACVKHRGAAAADGLSSDGCGVLTPIPPTLFGEGTGVIALFVRGADARTLVEQAATVEGVEVLDWRKPETDDSVLGHMAKATRPEILQAVISAPSPGAAYSPEVTAFRLRRHLAGAEGLYVASCSYRSVVYKSLAAADHLADFYTDLADDRYEAAFTIFHQRFSTNTLPTWERAQPFRTLCHNGEINAIQGNQNRMVARAVLGTDAAGLGPEELFRPVLDPQTSDSGKLDEALELLIRGGRDIRHALAMLVPEAWEHAVDLDPEVRGFYRYHSALMEPWDGPAGLVFTDGVGVGAALDRNGLRPLRYAICEDGLVVCCSEVGAVDVSGHGSVERGRLGPGDMLFVDPTRGVQRNDAVKTRLAAAAPYSHFAHDGFLTFGPGEPVQQVPDDVEARQAVHGYTKDELAQVVRAMASDGKEPTFSMGDDSPLPPMAGRPRPIHHYLKQRFAQVTNPPIDALREHRVMSLRTLLGPRAPILAEAEDATRLLRLESFLLYPEAVEDLLHGSTPFNAVTLDASFAVEDGSGGLRVAVERLADSAEQAVQGDADILVLTHAAVGPDRAPIPSVLAVGAVHHRLIANRRRTEVSLVVVADDARDVHFLATLLGYGADAICPRLALQTVADEADRSDNDAVTSPEAQGRFVAAAEAGVLKILSKMGISTVDSYRGAQIFEVIGLAPEVVDLCLRGTPSAVGGVGWEHLGEDILALMESAEPAWSGFYRVRTRGEYHAHADEVVAALNALTLVKEEQDPELADMTAAHLLQRAIRGESWDLYEQFRALVDERPPTELHDLLELVEASAPVPLDEVEPATDIARRFSTGAMSHGALGKEAHETLAQAMNLLGGLSNCGEGGEDPYRYYTRGLGRDDKNSRIKQIASGRFGVTPEYLVHADELQIKMAQGSKPGEGGQLPGHKVSDEIARLRHTQPGVGLISPPPHHDIYSIEDLAQLIYDLKQVNRALVSVKLVAEDGVGTIAAGCVKALADVVHISGQNGGTGASPLSSIKHAGMAWELGLADAQRALVDNGLRGRARLRVDGGFKTGRQVVVAALLGADEYSFGTSAMIAEGCIMLRACHKDTCKPGVATQRPHLRANFTGSPEGVAAYLLFVAEDVRHHLARIGARSVEEVIGRVDLLQQRRTGDRRIDSFDLAEVIAPPEHLDEPRHFVERVGILDPRSPLGDRVREDAFQLVWDGDEIDLSYPITNADRSVGAALAGAIALEFGAMPPRGTARVRFEGSAGQSFGAFLSHGAEFLLVGEANDYVGKGMGGGRIVIAPPPGDAGDPVLAGNTCLYGATAGELFVAGAVGERFAVRNSGALAVVEGAGDHCCEYMTGGTVVVLGPVGHNLGAGMTGGQAFIFDPDTERVMTRINTDLVEALRPEPDDVDEVRWLVERHLELTGSNRAAELLKVWDQADEMLWHVLPWERPERRQRIEAHRVSAA